MVWGKEIPIMQFCWQTSCQREFEIETYVRWLYSFYFWEFVSLVQQKYFLADFSPCWKQFWLNFGIYLTTSFGRAPFGRAAVKQFEDCCNNIIMLFIQKLLTIRPNVRGKLFNAFYVCGRLNTTQLIRDKQQDAFPPKTAWQHNGPLTVYRMQNSVRPSYSPPTFDVHI